MTGPTATFITFEGTEVSRAVLLFLALEEEDLDAADARFRLGEAPRTELWDLGFRNGRLDFLFRGSLRGTGAPIAPLAAFLEEGRALAELVYVAEGGSIWWTGAESRVRRPTFVLRLELSAPKIQGRVVSWAWRTRSARVVLGEGRGAP